MKKIRNIISRIRKCILKHCLYIIADGADNSITFSRPLFRHLCRHADNRSPARVFTFYIPEWHAFGFSVNPAVDPNAGIADIQYNSRFRSIGYESLCPSVGYIFHRYGIHAYAKVMLSVTPRTLPSGILVYVINPPEKINI